jgi:hypothetical protein
VLSVLIASEAAWRLDRSDVVEIEIKDGLQGLAGGAITGGFGQRLEPSGVLGLQRQELGDGVMPALWPAAAIGRPTISDRRHLGVTRSVERLALGSGERPFALWLASSWHDNPLYSVT